jgi:outer membrane protein assembly factor BamB
MSSPAVIAAPNGDSSQNFPTDLVWTVDVSARPVANPVASGDLLFLALQSTISARRLRDGSEVWNVAIEVDGAMAATASRLIVPSKGEVRALDSATGRVIWTDALGALTAPPLVQDDLLVVASADRLTAYQVADGTKLWTADVGRVEERPAAHGARLYVPLAEGPLLALDRATGKQIWEHDVGIKPTEPIVYADRIFVGSAAKSFCSLMLSTGREDWCYPIGAAVFGKAAADAARVYFVALDNQLYGLNRREGTLRWRTDLRYRPAAGPTIVGNTVSAPGKAAALQAFDVASGKPAAQLKLSDELFAVPVFIAGAEGGPVTLAALAGGLQNVWRLTLAAPPVPVFPSPAVAPLTVLPGQAVPLGALPAPPG